MTFQPEKPKGASKAVLYSSSLGSLTRIDPKSKAHKNIHLVSRCQKAWNEAKKHIEALDAYASQISIKTTPNPNSPNRDEVTLSYRDKRGDLRHISQRDIPQALVDKVVKIRKLIRPNLPDSRSPPLQTSVPLPRTCREFLQTDFKDFEASLPEPAKAAALRTVVATEAMIQGFRIHLSSLIEKKQEDLSKTPLLPHLAHKKKSEDLEHLKKLHRELESIDRYAVFRAIATWGNLHTGPLNHSQHQAVRAAADTISLATRADLQKKENNRQQQHWIKDKLGLFNRASTEEIHGYALDVGDLIIQERTESNERAQETERHGKKSCVEQLVVQMMMNLQDPATHVDLSHPILADLSEETRQQVGAIIEAPLPSASEGHPPQFYPKAYARVIYDQVNAAGDLETRLEALRNIEDEQIRNYL